MPQQADVTQLLERLGVGDRQAVDALLPLVYHELHELAERHLRRERRDNSLQATALVHEAYMRLVDQRQQRWQNRAHFVAVAAQAMRRILVDHARGKGRQKRGGGQGRIPLDDALLVSYERHADLVDLDDALKKLDALSPERARLVEMRFFGGLSMEEVAGVMGVSVSTAQREWRYARAWLYRELERCDSSAGGGGGDGG